MVYTPYPNWDTAQENPSILKSNDGINWFEVCKNPIVEKPCTGHNNDPFLFFDNCFKCVYNHYYVDEQGTENTIIKSIESPDGIEWGNIKEIVHKPEIMVSPCVVDGELWHIKVKVAKKGEPKLPYGLYKGETPIKFDIPNRLPWHFEIRKTDKYRMLFSAFKPFIEHPALSKLFYAESDNGINWSVNTTPFFDSYKASFIYDNQLRIWHSDLRDNVWHIDYALSTIPVC